MIPYIIVGITLAISLILWIHCQHVKSKLRSKNKALEIANTSIEEHIAVQQEFITFLGQELRTPLYGIIGLTHFLSEETPSLKDNKKIKSLKFSGDYLLFLINNILKVNYIDSQEIGSPKKTFDLREVTENLLQLFEHAAENSSNKLHFDFDPAITSMVKGDPEILSQILINLISNALQFNRNGNVYFSIYLIKSLPNSQKISFKVAYDGSEVSEEDEEFRYREFIHIDKAKKSYLNADLNSKILQKLSGIINGEILKTEANKSGGSEYVLVADLEAAIKEEKSVKPTPDIPKILVVDDNKLNLLIVDKILSAKNYECITVDNGFEAIDLARENKYSLILMDINMPKLNGIGTTKRIREFDASTPIIALTAVDISQLNDQMTQAGINDYISKPYSQEILLNMISDHIDRDAIS